MAEGSVAADLKEVLEKLTLMLGPFAPYLAEELWEEQAAPVRCSISRGRITIPNSPKKKRPRS